MSNSSYETEESGSLINIFVHTVQEWMDIEADESDEGVMSTSDISVTEGICQWYYSPTHKYFKPSSPYENPNHPYLGVTDWIYFGTTDCGEIVYYPWGDVPQ